jgi:uncharacterized membrane protein
MERSWRRPMGAVVGFLALVGVAASATHYLVEPYNPGFLEYPAIVALHVVLGGVYLLFAPFQFVGRVRSRHIGYHSLMGRVLVAAGMAVGATALFVGLAIPFSGRAESVLIGLFGGLFLFALLKGFVHIRAGRVALHREWMIRAFAIALAIPTRRLIFVPSLLVPGVADPTDGRTVALSLAAWAAALVVHSTLAEAWIRLTRKRGLPKASRAETASEASRETDDVENAGAMILRVWRAKIVPGRVGEYRRFEWERCLPTLRRQPGFLGVLSLWEAGTCAASVTVWEDRGVVDALESSPSYRTTSRATSTAG